MIDDSQHGEQVTPMTEVAEKYLWPAFVYVLADALTVGVGHKDMAGAKDRVEIAKMIRAIYAEEFAHLGWDIEHTEQLIAEENP